MIMAARSHDTLIFFTYRGKAYATRTYQIPDSARVGKGVSVHNIFDLSENEKVTAAMAVPNLESAEICTMATLNGKVKRLALSELASMRRNGIAAINLDEGDELGWVRLTHGNDEIIMVTILGQALRFDENQIRQMGRAAGGVAGIKLHKGDKLASMEVVEKGGYLLVVTQKGYGKRTALSEYSSTSRASLGVSTIDHKALPKIGEIAVARVVQEGAELTLISTNGVVLRTEVKKIGQQGRATRGVRIMALDDGDSLASIARLAEADLKSTEK